MADAAGRAQPVSWYLRAGRAAGAGFTGAVVGAVVAVIWHAGWKAAGNTCRSTSWPLCIPVVPLGAAVLGSVLVIGVVVGLGFGLLEVRPKPVTIPVGCVVAAMLIFAVGTATPDGTPPEAWAAALAAGAGLTALALTFDAGRVRIAGVVAIAVVLVGANTLPHLIRSQAQQDARERQLTALGVPLMLPVAVGYHASGADAVNGSLSVTMSSNMPGKSALAQLGAFTVSITPATTAPTEPLSDGQPVQCQYVAPQGCRELKRGLWLLPAPARGGEVITWRGDLEVVVMSLGYSPVSTKALVHAATTFQPTTAAALAALGP